MFLTRKPAPWGTLQRFIAGALLVAGSTVVPRAVSQDSYLSEGGLRNALVGYTLRGQDWAEYYEPGGIIHGKVRMFGTRSYTGRWSIQSDRVCYDYEGTSYDTCSRLKIENDRVLHFDLQGNLKRDGVAIRILGNNLQAF